MQDIIPGSYTASGSSSPRMITAAGGAAYFTARDSVSGFELWKSDGTEAGTVMLRDICSGELGSDPNGMFALGSTVFFTADDRIVGRELWKTDGTGAGTALVKDINPGTGSSSSFGTMAALGNTVFFAANDGVNGYELWKTDGTAAGTVMVKDLAPGATGSGPNNLTVIGTTLYFTAFNGTTGQELFKTDGTTAGTQLVKDIAPGSPGSGPRELTAVGTTLFFVADDGVSGFELWTSDGTTVGTNLVKDLAPGAASASARYLTEMGGRVYFAAVDPSAGMELWTSDGTATGTVLVKDVLAGANSSGPGGLTRLGSTLFFYAFTNTFTQVELWKTDGTAAGTVRVKDLGTGGYTPTLLGYGGRLVFSRSTGPLVELWTSDGTETGTVIATSVPLTANSVQQVPLTSAAGKVFFAAGSSATGEEVYVTDGTAAGTSMTKDVSSPVASALQGLTTWGAVGNTVYFSAGGSATGRELWKSDGTPSGTVLVKDIRSGVFGSDPSDFAVLGSTVFFTADDGVSGKEVWKTDGTAAGTVMVKDLSPGSGSLMPQKLIAAGSAVFFTNQLGTTQLYKTDGTAAGTGIVKDVSVGGPANPWLLTPVGNGLFFVAPTSTANPGDEELWKSDGTAAGTVIVKDIRVGTTGSSPRGLFAAGTSLYFTADEGVNGRELWKSDGTSAGTTLVRDISAGTASTFASYFDPAFVAVGNTLFFVADDGNLREELWKTDGTSAGTVMLRDIAKGYVFAPRHQLAAVGTTVFFFDTTVAAGRELWKTDGTIAGTVMVKELAPGAESGTYAGEMLSLAPDEALVFTANDGRSGLELWRSDGTAAQTAQVADLRAGAASSVPNSMVKAGSNLFFAAYDDVHGRELWAISLPNLRRDYEPPIVTCPGSLVAEATSAAGAAVTYAAATAVDDRPGTPTIAYSQPSGATFALGTSVVTAIASDAAGNTAQCSFQISVVDTTAPTLSCPGPATAEATSSSGAPVSYPPAQVSDTADPAPQVSSSAASGSTFGLGATAVTVNATDASANSSTCTFSVTVVDTTPPALSCPQPATAEATSTAGAVVSWAAPTATDLVTGPTQVTLSQGSGAVFPLGTTPVTASSSDDAGNSASCTFEVIVADTTPPALTCPAAVSGEATQPGGAQVSFDGGVATDLVSGTTAVSYSTAPGSLFALGETLVTATSTDGAGNTASCTFPVSVSDTTPPSLSCPSDLETDATDDSGATVTYAAPTASDAVSTQPALSLSQASGTHFAPGTTTVTATARDAAGNAATCSFQVIVHPAAPTADGGTAAQTADAGSQRPPETGPSGCGCSGTGSGALGYALLAGLAFGRRRRAVAHG